MKTRSSNQRLSTISLRQMGIHKFAAFFQGFLYYRKTLPICRGKENLRAGADSAPLPAICITASRFLLAPLVLSIGTLASGLRSGV